MKNNIKLGLTVVLLAGSCFAGKHKNYGLAGCGLGSMMMGPTGSQVLAGTTNSSTYNQLFGITSGTSNCAEDGVALADREKEYFAEANFESLKQEMAQGKGENLEAFASLMGCSSQTFASAAQGHYNAIFAPGVDSENMLRNIETLVGSDAGFQAACRDVN